MSWNFDKYRMILKSDDEYSKCDEIFEEWYEIAKRYARTEDEESASNVLKCTNDALMIIIGKDNPGILLTGNEYVVKSLLECVRKFFVIFRTKPKFTKLLHIPTNLQFIGSLVKNTTNCLLDSIINIRAKEDNRIESAKTLSTIVQLGETLVLKNQTFWSYFKLEVSPLISIIVKTSQSLTLRENIVKVLQSYYFTSKEDNVIRTTLAKNGKDVVALELLWRLRGFCDMSCMQIIVGRISSDGPGEKFSSDESLATIILKSVYETVINLQSDPEMKGKFDPESQEMGICRILKECDTFLSSRSDHLDSFERSDSIFQTIRALIEMTPKSKNYIDILLTDPVTVGSVSLINSLGYIFDEHMWQAELLPFTCEKISNMNLNGVSGDQLSQEIIDLVRECARIYYLNTDREPSVALGKTLIEAVFEAIRHGYIETERFPEIATRILAYHVDSSSDNSPFDWIETALSDYVCHNHKTQRAINEVMQQLLGLESSASSYEIATGNVISPFNVEEVMDTIASLRTRPSELFWIDFILNNAVFVYQRQNTLLKLINSIESEVNRMLMTGEINFDRLHSMMDLVTAVIRKCVSPRNAPIIFDLTIKMMAINPSSDLSFQDRLLSRVVDKVSMTAPLNMAAVATCLQIGGPETRETLAHLVPHLCLQDPVPEVRVAAMRAMILLPHLISQYADCILNSCLISTISSSKDVSATIAINELDLLDAAAPLLALLAISHPSSMECCVARLTRAASISARNDSMDKSSAEVIIALDRIAVEGSLTTITKILSSKKKYISSLLKYSPKWKEVVSSLGFTSSTRVNIKESVKDFVSELTNRNTADDYKLLDDDTDAALIISEADLAYENMKNAVKHKNIKLSLQQVRILRCRYPTLWVERNVSAYFVNNILPDAAAKLLPKPLSKKNDGSNEYSKDDLLKFQNYINTMRSLLNIAPDEVEAILGMSSIIFDFSKAKVLNVLSLFGADAARQVLRESSIYSPELYSLIDKSELKLNDESLSINDSMISEVSEATSADSKDDSGVLTGYLNVKDSVYQFSNLKDINLHWQRLRALSGDNMTVTSNPEIINTKEEKDFDPIFEREAVMEEGKVDESEVKFDLKLDDSTYTEVEVETVDSIRDPKETKVIKKKKQKQKRKVATPMF